MIKNLITKLFNRELFQFGNKKHDVSTTTVTTRTKTMFPPSRGKSSNRPKIEILRSTQRRSDSTHRQERKSNPPGGAKAAILRHDRMQLLAEGYLGIGLVGMHSLGFVIKTPVRPDNYGLAEKLGNLRERIKMTPSRNLPEGIARSLEVMEDAPAGRCAIVVITSGGPTINEASMRKLVESAILRGIGVHIILVGSDPVAENQLAHLAKPGGFWSFNVANTSGELQARLFGAFEGVLPASRTDGTNTGLIVVDCSEKMVEPFAGTTRIEILVDAVSGFLGNAEVSPLVRGRAA